MSKHSSCLYFLIFAVLHQRLYNIKWIACNFFIYNFIYMGSKNPWADWAQIFLVIGVHDVITPFKFGDDRFRGFWLAEGQSLPFPIDFEGRPYNTRIIVWRASMMCHCLHCVSKKACDYIFCNNLNNECSIIIIFGTLINETICHRMVVSFPTSSILKNLRHLLYSR